MKLALPLLLFTDLDGTLLDHYDYSWSAASEALAALKVHRVPIIFNTSKTLEESLGVWRKLELGSPIVFENGAGIALPVKEWSEPDVDWSREDEFWVKSCAVSYRDVRAALLCLRRDAEFRFTGFGDMDVDQVQKLTGLGRLDASSALRRRYCEPLIWRDTEERFDEFTVALQTLGLTHTQGGRFLHVMGPANKGSATRWLADCYKPKPQLVALGDGQNDLPMLSQADVGVLVRSPAHDLPHFPVAQQPPCFRVSDEYGPRGWNSAVLAILEELQGG